MQFAMMTAAQWDRELITDLSPQGASLRATKVIGVRRTSSADKAGFLGHRPDVVAITHPPRFWQGEYGLVDASGSARTSGSLGSIKRLHHTSNTRRKAGESLLLRRSFAPGLFRCC
jgi:hypothetical protein